jgi:ferredoxin--NADP+ reductase
MSNLHVDGHGASSDVKKQSEIEPFNATITQWTDLHEELAVFRVEPDGGSIPDFVPGQFATLGLPRQAQPIHPEDNYPEGDIRWSKLWRRAYSIASSPLEKRFLEFYVVLVKEGKLTPKLWHSKVGTRLWLDPHIKGEFTLHDIPTGRDLLMISTGTGLAPYLSMLKTYRNTGRWNRYIIMHGVRVAKDLGYRDELMQIAAQDPSVVYVPSCTREPDGSDWAGQRGRVTTVLSDPAAYQKCTGTALDPATTSVFLCGNPDMLNQCEAILHDRGFVTATKKSPGNIHVERYW